MFKTDLIERMSMRFPQLAPKDSANAVNLIIEELTVALATGERATFQGFGSFEMRQRKSRKAKDPKTGKAIQVAAKQVVRFSPAKELKERCDAAAYIRNGTMNADMLERMSVSADLYTLEQIVERADCPTALSQRILMSFATSADPKQRIDAANRAKILPADALRALTNDSDVCVREALAKNIPIDQVAFLMTDAEVKVRVAIVGRSDIPEDVAIKMTSDVSADVRCTLAKNNKAISVLSVLATDPDAEIRTCIVGVRIWNRWSPRECPPEILTAMATDIEPRVRVLVAMNEKCPESVLRELATDDGDDVRMALLGRKLLPPDIVAMLSSDKSVEIRAQLALRDAASEDILETLACDADVHVRARVAGHRYCPENILRKLGVDQDPWVRKMVAYSERCPIDLLRKLSQDNSSDVRAEVAGNHRCPPAILGELSHDARTRVRASVAGNKNCPDAVLENLSKDKDPTVFGTAVRTIQWR